MSWIDDCRTKCRKIKHIDDEFTWEEKPNRSSYLVARSSLLDEKLNRIRDLYLTGEYRPLRKGRGEIFTLALQFYWQPGELRRVFMLEVYPAYMESHRDSVVGRLHGPHLHLGDHRLEQVVKEVRALRDGMPFSHWARRFVRHARVHSKEIDKGIPGPFSADMFG